MLFPITEQPVPFLCPPGLEGLLDTGQLVIHKDNLRRNKGSRGLQQLCLYNIYVCINPKCLLIGFENNCILDEKNLFD